MRSGDVVQVMEEAHTLIGSIRQNDPSPPVQRGNDGKLRLRGICIQCLAFLPENLRVGNLTIKTLFQSLQKIAYSGSLPAGDFGIQD